MRPQVGENCVKDTTEEENHQKYDKIAIVWNVGISEDDENFLEKRNEEVLNKMADEQVYIITAIQKRKENYLLWSRDQT